MTYVTAAAWRRRLDALDASWLTMVAEGDMPAIRQRVTRAVAFAACTVHTPVEEAEWQYTEWLTRGSLPEGSGLAEMKSSAIITSREWIAELTLDVVQSWTDGWKAAEYIASHTYGLAMTKASFAAALIGYPEPYCLDTHGLQLVASRMASAGIVVPLERLRSRTRRWGSYRATGEWAFGSRDHQWEYFACTVTAFARDGHEAYFSTVLT